MDYKNIFLTMNDNSPEQSLGYANVLININSTLSLRAEIETQRENTIRYTPLLNDSFCEKNAKNALSEKIITNSVFIASNVDTKSFSNSFHKNTPTKEDLEMLKGYVQVRYKRKIELVDSYSDK